MKFREKQRNKQTELVNKYPGLKEKNNQLNQQLYELKNEKQRLIYSMIQHRDCNCDIIKKYVMTNYML